MNCKENDDLSNCTIEEVKEEIHNIMENHLDNFPVILHTFTEEEKEKRQGNGYVRALDLLTTCLDATDSDYQDLTFDEFVELLEQFTDHYRGNTSDDEWINNLPCGRRKDHS